MASSVGMRLRAALIRAVGHRPLLYIRPLSDRRRDSLGRCSVCGETTSFAFNSWVIPADVKREWQVANLADRLVERETMYCRRCGASLRIRRLAEVLILHYASEAETAAELIEEPAFRRLDIAEINRLEALHPILGSHPRLFYSEFREGAELGAFVDGVPSEDVSQLTYRDASFDLVLTSDTLEHVPDYRLALREIRRVLRPGGRHIFTVPAVPSRLETLTRATRTDDGELLFQAPPQYHGRGSGPLALASPARRDFLAYHDFGMDLVDELRKMGFVPETHFYCDSDPGSDVALVFCAEAV